MEGYEFKTTFWRDFYYAERFGIDAIKGTFTTAFNSWKDNVEYLTELVLVLNWKIWKYYEVGNNEYASLYNELWEKADAYALDNLKGEDLQYFLEVTD